MEKVNNLSQIGLINFKSYSEYMLLGQLLIDLLIICFDEIKKKLESETNIIKFIYLYRDWFHKILYDREEIAKIELGEQKKNLYYNFYLNLLIKENPEIINYTYSLDFIKAINKERKKTLQKHKLIMFSKIIVDLIDNYRETDEYNENEERVELEEIKKENIQIIKNNIEAFKEIDLNLNKDDILKKKIDEIYFDVINALISSKKIEDFEYSSNLLEQLDLQNINLTKTIFDGLMNGQNYIKDYEINNAEDLNDERKINFYYLFLKFIFKNSIYIYNFPFLLKTKKLFLELLKQDKTKQLKENKKIEFIVSKILDSKILDSKYNSLKYYESNNENNYGNINEILKFYEEFLFEVKIEDIKKIKDIIKIKKSDNEKYLKDYDKDKKINERIPIIKYNYNFENKGNFRNEKICQKTVLDNFEMIKEKKIEKEFGEMIVKENNKKILSKILEDYFINFLKEYSNNNNINISETLINENENKNIENSNKIVNEINNYQYNKPFENEVKSKNNINCKSLESNKSLITREFSTVKNEKKLNDVGPAINNRKENLTFDILKKCSIKFHTNVKGEEPYIIYDEILCGEHNIKIDYIKFLKNKYDFEHYQQRNELEENYLKLFYFLKEIENRIDNEFIFNYKLKIKLDIRKEDVKNNSDPTYNISCLYTFYDPINNLPHKFKDENILINGTNSLNQGFQLMLYQINSEYYKNLKYQEFDITYKLESSSISACLLEPDLSRTNDKNSIFESIKMIGQYINYRTEAFETRNQYILSINIDIIDNKKSEYFNDTISCIFQSKITEIY